MHNINCPQCHQEIEINLTACPHCKAAQGLESLCGVDPDIRIKNQRLAVWFSILFGGLGVHKFYLGHYLKGSLYLVFSWTLVPFIVGWVDAVRTFKMSAFSFEKRYSRKVSHH